MTVAELVGPRFQRIFHGIYVAADIPITVAVRAKAALLVAPDGSYASHHTAVRTVGRLGAGDVGDAHQHADPVIAVRA